MRKTSKRCLAATLTGAMAMSVLLTGCGKSGSGSGGKDTLPELPAERYTLDASKPAWQLDQKTETTELTWYVNADWWNTDWGTDTVTKQVKKDLNINVTFITGDDTKLNTFCAGGEKPDMSKGCNAV